MRQGGAKQHTTLGCRRGLVYSQQGYGGQVAPTWCGRAQLVPCSRVFQNASFYCFAVKTCFSSRTAGWCETADQLCATWHPQLGLGTPRQKLAAALTRGATTWFFNFLLKREKVWVTQLFATRLQRSSCAHFRGRAQLDRVRLVLANGFKKTAQPASPSLSLKEGDAIWYFPFLEDFSMLFPVFRTAASHCVILLKYAQGACGRRAWSRLLALRGDLARAFGPRYVRLFIHLRVERRPSTEKGRGRQLKSLWPHYARPSALRADDAFGLRPSRRSDFSCGHRSPAASGLQMESIANLAPFVQKSGLRPA